MKVRLLVLILSALLISTSAIAVNKASAQNPVTDINHTHVSVGEINRVHYDDNNYFGPINVGFKEQQQNINSTHIPVGEINHAADINRENNEGTQTNEISTTQRQR